MQIQIFSHLLVDVLPVKRISIAHALEAVIVAGNTCEGALSAFEHLRQIVSGSIAASAR